MRVHVHIPVYIIGSLLKIPLVLHGPKIDRFVRLLMYLRRRLSTVSRNLDIVTMNNTFDAGQINYANFCREIFNFSSFSTEVFTGSTTVK